MVKKSMPVRIGILLTLVFALVFGVAAHAGATPEILGSEIVATSVAPLDQPAGPAVVQSAYAGKKVGIIGQSFISANGGDEGSVWYQDNESYQPGTTGPDNLCYRSLRAAGVQAAEYLGMSYVFAACAGAEPENIYRKPQYNEGVQTDWLTPDMAAVIMGGRGNPEFGKVIEQMLDPTRDPGIHCQFVEGTLPGQCSLEQDLLKWAVTAYENRTAEEQAIYDTIQARAPNAQVYSMGIPKVVPELGDDISVCGWFLSPYEVKALDAMVEALNAMIRELAEKNHAIFVDPNRPDGPWAQGRHDLCAPYPNSWVWGARLLVPPNHGELTNFERWITGMFHPTIAAQDAMAWALQQTMLEHAA